VIENAHQRRELLPRERRKPSQRHAAGERRAIAHDLCVLVARHEKKPPTDAERDAIPRVGQLTPADLAACAYHRPEIPRIACCAARRLAMASHGVQPGLPSPLRPVLAACAALRCASPCTAALVVRAAVWIAFAKKKLTTHLPS
jgi:hypothetical protein